MADIQLLISDASNRRALASVVQARHTPIVDDELRDVDLYMIDDRTLPQYRETLETYKREQHPVFCPVILIRREHTSITIDLPEPDAVEGPRLINEILTAPIEKPILFHRLTNLLVRRNQTVELQEKTERLDEFASKLQHELRNPLQILNGYLMLAQESEKPVHFEKCKKALNRMERMINDILLIARGGDVEVEPESVGLPALLETSWAAISAPDAQLEIETEDRVSADRDLLHELIENLLRNAIEHGGTDVTITVGSLPDGFYIEDDGVGIPEDERDAVFEKGYSTSQLGTGFGLTIVAKIIDAHGWEIRVTEGTDGGARFEITGVHD